MDAIVNGGNEEMVTETIEIPKNCVKFVIGQNGSQIAFIQRESGCRIQISGFSLTSANMNTCVLMGTKNTVNHAKNLIKDILARNNGSPQPAASSSPSTTVFPSHVPIGHVDRTLLIPGTKCGLIIGKNGDIIKALQQQLDVKMWLAQDSIQVTNAPKHLHIRGTLSNVTKACQTIENILTTEIPPSFIVGLKTMGEVYIPRSCVPTIIGKAGKTIKRLRSQSGCHIQFKCNEPPNSYEQCATLVGTPEEISRASQMISETLFEASQKRNAFQIASHLPYNNQTQSLPTFTSTVTQPTSFEDYWTQWAEYYAAMYFQNQAKKQ